MTAFIASKAAVAAFTCALAAEPAAQPILVSAAAPPIINASQSCGDATGGARRMTVAKATRVDHHISCIVGEQGDDRRDCAGAGSQLTTSCDYVVWRALKCIRVPC